MINGAKYPEFTPKVIVINTQCKFFLSVSLKCCSSYEEFLKHKKWYICDNIVLDIVQFSTLFHKSVLN